MEEHSTPHVLRTHHIGTALRSQHALNAHPSRENRSAFVRVRVRVRVVKPTLRTCGYTRRSRLSDGVTDKSSERRLILDRIHGSSNVRKTRPAFAHGCSNRVLMDPASAASPCRWGHM